MCHIPTLKSTLAPHNGAWGTDSTACPVGGKIEFWEDQNPIVPQPIPGGGLVGLNIDRCISPQRLIADLPTSHTFSTVMRECLMRDVDNSSF